MNSALADPSQCFSHLIEHIPLWLTRVTDLASHTAAKHAEFAAEYTRLSKARPRHRRRRNSSLHTNRPDDDNRSVTSRKDRTSSGSTSRHLDPQDPFMDPMIFKRLTRQNNQDAINRKRKPDAGFSATPSDGDSGVARRVRQQVVIHYDAQTQTALERLVRDIGGARNQIRKGRMNYMMKVDFGRRAFPSRLFPGADDDENAIALPPRPSFRKSRSTQFDTKEASATTTNGTTTTSTQAKPSSSAFDLADKQLELAQSLCETAAHQFLRNGDCSRELSRTLERLGTALEMAQAEEKRLEAEKEAEKQRQQAEEEEQESKSDRTAVETVGPADTEIQMQVDSHQPMKVKMDMNGDVKAPPEMMGAIEVDDGSSTSSISIDLAAFRRRRFKA
ncbi:uncharacterized protein GIQ15_02407 [Arthroderma uncinatum]|uniref:uncharacterized protein n=1 Tax=Arthroderma uncinatum TaxID=74035 RepID=UPI00144AA8A6|nr:uncharacterized protein GIQ15_02407 [Arthroderma uncinatum]KAF3483083.1 hypothetical protein GIQ15_02407 [Arthroderma uncinatum]